MRRVAQLENEKKICQKLFLLENILDIQVGHQYFQGLQHVVGFLTYGEGGTAVPGIQAYS